MSRHEIAVPRLGEGVQEVRIVRLLVDLHAYIERDAPLIEVETDKANLTIESPVAGTLTEILCCPDEVMSIGEIMAVVTAAGELDAAKGPTHPAHDLRSPDAQAVRIRRRHQVRTSERTAHASVDRAGSVSGLSQGVVHQVSRRQQLIGRGLRESQSIPVATIEMQLNWTAVERLRRRNFGEIRPSGLELIAWAVMQAMQSHRRFRAIRHPTNEYHIIERSNVGIAVALPDDELAIAAVGDQNCTNFHDFVLQMRGSIATAAERGSAAGAALVISDMSSFGVTGATPVVVAPSVATLFIGAPEWRPEHTEDAQISWLRTCRIILAFDHILINGAGAASFLHDALEILTSDSIVYGYSGEGL